MNFRIAAVAAAALALTLAPASAQTVIDRSATEVSPTTLASIMTLFGRALEDPEAASIRNLEQVDEEVACGEVNVTDTEEEGFVQFAYIHLNNRLVITAPDSDDPQKVADNAFAARICEHGFPTI